MMRKNNKKMFRLLSTEFLYNKGEQLLEKKLLKNIPKTYENGQ